MVIIAKRTVKEFIEIYPKSKGSLLRWYLLVKEGNWSSFSELKNSASGVDSVGNDLYVFNLGGNKYRLIARIFFPVRTVYIRFVGTHKQYDQVNLSDL
jgi:mRNA interferase HigB